MLNGKRPVNTVLNRSLIRPVRLTRTPLAELARNVSFLVSTIFIVDTIFDGGQNRIKTVLGGRLQLSGVLGRSPTRASRLACGRLAHSSFRGLDKRHLSHYNDLTTIRRADRDRELSPQGLETVL